MSALHVKIHTGWKKTAVTRSLMWQTWAQKIIMSLLNLSPPSPLPVGSQFLSYYFSFQIVKSETSASQLSCGLWQFIVVASFSIHVKIEEPKAAMIVSVSWQLGPTGATGALAARLVGWASNAEPGSVWMANVLEKTWRRSRARSRPTVPVSPSVQLLITADCASESSVKLLISASTLC